MKCIDCKHARMTGGKSKEHVGCALASKNRGESTCIINDIVNDPIYEGWIYAGRRPDDFDFEYDRSKDIGSGALINYSIILKNDNYCKHYEKRRANIFKN